jgi:hypothetical protein
LTAPLQLQHDAADIIPVPQHPDENGKAPKKRKTENEDGKGKRPMKKRRGINRGALLW